MCVHVQYNNSGISVRILPLTFENSDFSGVNDLWPLPPNTYTVSSTQIPIFPSDETTGIQETYSL
jgi:hypothetical protein